jgi:hypothetical protein
MSPDIAKYQSLGGQLSADIHLAEGIWKYSSGKVTPFETPVPLGTLPTKPQLVERELTREQEVTSPRFCCKRKGFTSDAFSGLKWHFFTLLGPSG